MADPITLVERAKVFVMRYPKLALLIDKTIGTNIRVKEILERQLVDDI